MGNLANFLQKSSISLYQLTKTAQKMRLIGDILIKYEPKPPA